MTQPTDSSSKTEPFHTETISFLSDDCKLSGVLHLPERQNPPVVIGSHGLLSDGNSGKQVDLAAALNEKGIAYFRFHHRGAGSSEGDRATSTLDTRVTDLVSAWNMLKERNDLGRPFGLFGSSMGGATCIAAWSAIRPAATLLIAPPILGKEILNKSEEEAAALMAETGLPEEFYRNNLGFDLTERIPGMQNLLVFHGTDDDVVPVENGHRTYELAAEPKRFIALEGGDHRISHPGHRKVFMMKSVAFYEEKLTLKARTCGLSEEDLKTP